MSRADQPLAASPTTPPSAPVLDRKVFAQLIEIVGWDEAPQIWEDFQTDSARLAGDLDEAVRGKDAAKMTHAAHALKGMSQMFGAEQLAQACDTVCQLARVGDLAAAEPVVAKVQAALPLTTQAIAREFVSR